MDRLIPLVSQIHDIIRRSEANIELSLPIIAVIGSQSTGKSSLLESIIGKQFLPKGKGIVTRRPIEIQLVHIEGDREYVEFADRKNEQVEDFQAIRKVIEEETDKVCGNTKGVSSLPIKLRFFSKHALDLLLVDLPGITKNPIGDQPKDIEFQVLGMLKQYIRNENCLIMAVSKATDDLANSESLKLARQVDPQGTRTIGVLTQMDLIEENLDLIKDFNNLANPLKLGYVGVYLRANKSGVTIQEQYDIEKEFFEQHPTYSKYTQTMGVKYLIKTLNVNLIKHIKKMLPSLRENIILNLELRNQELRNTGGFDKITDKKAQGMFILALLSRFVKCFNEMIDGRSIDNKDELVGGARIQYIFSSIFNTTICGMNPFQFLTDEDLRTAIRNANGLRKSLFVAEVAFQDLIRQQISRLLLPSLQCSHLVHEQLRKMLHLVNVKEIQRFHKLHRRVFIVMEDLLDQCLKKTEDMIKQLIEIEMGYINNNHPDFIQTLTTVQNEEKKQQDKDHGEEEPKFKFKQTTAQNGIYTKKKNQLEQFKTEVEMYDSKILDTKDKKGSKDSEQDKPDAKEFSVSSGSNPPEVNYLQLADLYNISRVITHFPRELLPQVPETIRVLNPPKRREQKQTELIKELMRSYFNVVKKNINDSIPKTIVTFLINECKNSCEKVLVSNLYKEDEYEDLLYENDTLIKKREQTKKVITTLKQCLGEINKFSSRFN